MKYSIEDSIAEDEGMELYSIIDATPEIDGNMISLSDRHLFSIIDATSTYLAEEFTMNDKTKTDGKTN